MFGRRYYNWFAIVKYSAINWYLILTLQFLCSVRTHHLHQTIQSPVSLQHEKILVWFFLFACQQLASKTKPECRQQKEHQLLFQNNNKHIWKKNKKIYSLILLQTGLPEIAYYSVLYVCIQKKKWRPLQVSAIFLSSVQWIFFKIFQNQISAFVFCYLLYKFHKSIWSFYFKNKWLKVHEDRFILKKKCLSDVKRKLFVQVKQNKAPCLQKKKKKDKKEEKTSMLLC